MKAIKLLVVAVLASFAAEATAQLKKDLSEWTRVEFSFVAEKFKGENGNSEYEICDPKGASFGVMKGISLTNKVPLFLDLGGRLTWTHFKDDDKNGEWKYTFMNIAIPVNAAYKIAFSSAPNVTILPYFGPNFKFNFLAVNKWESEDGKHESKSHMLKDDEGDGKVFQFGLNLGVGVNLRSFYVGYNFQPDLSPFQKDGDNKTKTIQNYVTVGINL